MSAITLLFIALGLFSVYCVVVLTMGVRQAEGPVRPTLGAFLTGTVANFFDTLGIGSFATTTSAFRSFKMVQDEKIPGTLNAGYASAALFQSFLYISSVEVDPTTLIGMIFTAVLGAYVGAGLFAKWPKKQIQFGMGLALLVAGALFMYRNIAGNPTGGTATGLTGGLLVAGLVGNFVLGILMMIGVGLYGPCMLLISVLGMNPSTAFPIMMGSCAFLMPIAGGRFIKEKAVDIPVTVALAFSALPGVWLAYKFFSSLDVANLRWLVAVVVLITGIMLLKTALSKQEN